LPVERIEQMHDYILQLAVRGAPLIGCAAALALAVHVVKAWPKYVSSILIGEII
jgi:methylthioribose-1-phosphate isomerase